MLYADRAGLHLLTTSNKILCLLYTEEIENSLSAVGCSFFGVGRVRVKYNITSRSNTT